MQASTGNDRSKVAEIARRHGVSENTAMALLDAIRQGGGTMARFDLPELGGSGQWMQGGMVMVGNMFDNDLKARVAALCADLAGLGDGASGSRSAGSGNWWPVDLGSPDSAAVRVAFVMPSSMGRTGSSWRRAGRLPSMTPAITGFPACRSSKAGRPRWPSPASTAQCRSISCRW
jgi:hypothetical protein